jgi:hypothetical protein
MSADPLEQHLGRARSAESTGELFAVVTEHFLGNPYSAIAAINALHTARAVARGTTLAITE